MITSLIRFNNRHQKAETLDGSFIAWGLVWQNVSGGRRLKAIRKGKTDEGQPWENVVNEAIENKLTGDCINAS